MNRLLALAMLACPFLQAQTMDEPVVLKIDVDNAVLYRGGLYDASKLGKDLGPTVSAGQVPFVDGINIGDIVAINGQAVKGIWSSSYIHTTPYRSAPAPGQFIADVNSSATFFCTWQIYAPDGTFLGTIQDIGAGQGHAVSGALAGFFGATGMHMPGTQTGAAERVATTAEDPANRRSIGGGKLSVTFYVYPRVRPAVLVTGSGPAVSHQDYSPVTSSNPARPGETLILAATGLGSVQPNLEPPGAVAFSDSPYQKVNGPVTIVFNGKELPAINKIGWPGEKTIYWVDFQVPSNASAGTATLGLIATWIPGPTVSIPVGNPPLVK
jgi:uncharacterized protein (TIGR03437 family)